MYKLLILLTLLFACQTIPDINNQRVSSFDYKNSESKYLDLTVYKANGEPASNSKLIIRDESGDLILTAMTDKTGKFRQKLKIANHCEKLVITVNEFGINNTVEMKLDGESFSHVFKKEDAVEKQVFTKRSKVNANSSYTYLGTWDDNGVPDYLFPQNDIISQGLLDDIATTLPESNPIINSHPEYLASENESNIILQDSAEVYVTFVHEGAGYRNVLGFYTYTLGDNVTSTADISNQTIIFPNTSYLGSGGGLSSGNKVKIGNFPANTVIGWFLIANGWNSWSKTVGNGNWKLYSNADLNPESDPDKRKHNVLLIDEQQELLLLGFEDIRRDYSSCDNDFNDAVYYITANPFTAVVTENFSDITFSNESDSDGDGVRDNIDDFPNDPNLAFVNYYPSETTESHIAFEDLWPSRGDYDFNDLVVSFHYTQYLNPANKVVKMNVSIYAKAIGASFDNGLGFVLDIDPGQVSSVTGINLSGDLNIQLNANNTEAGQSKSVIIVTDHVANFYNGKRGFINTLNGDFENISDTLNIEINFNGGIALQDLGEAPYNPFIFVDKNRAREVHLMHEEPTDLAGEEYFGIKNDRSNPDNMEFYLDNNGKPFAIEIPSDWRHPIEKCSILESYYFFKQWAESNGTSYRSWYINDTDNYNNQKVW